MADGAAGSGALTAVSTDGAFSNPYPGMLPAGDAISSIAPDPGGADALWMTDERPPPSCACSSRPQPPASSSHRAAHTSSATTSTSTPPAASPAPPPTLTATLRPASAVTKDGATLNGTISEPAAQRRDRRELPLRVRHEHRLRLVDAAPRRRPSTPAGASVSATLSGLEPYTTYHYRLARERLHVARPARPRAPTRPSRPARRCSRAIDTTVGARADRGRDPDQAARQAPLRAPARRRADPARRDRRRAQGHRPDRERDRRRRAGERPVPRRHLRGHPAAGRHGHGARARRAASRGCPAAKPTGAPLARSARRAQEAQAEEALAQGRQPGVRQRPRPVRDAGATTRPPPTRAPPGGSPTAATAPWSR